MFKIFLFFLLISTGAFANSTDASAEAAPFGEAQTYLQLRNYMSAHGVYISDYKYMEDIPINDSDIIVAVIDDHISEVEGLEGQFWVNESELNGTAGVDDDGNGYVDDIHGWDFDGDQPIDINQGSDHGNYVTGVIAATLTERDDGILVRGVNPDVKIMRLYKPEGGLGAYNESLAIRYAVDNGARVINISHGVYDNANDDLLSAVQYAKSNQVYIVVSGPNDALTAEVYLDYFDDVFATARMTFSPDLQSDEDSYFLTGVWHDKIDYCLPQGMTSLTVSSGLYGTSYAAPVLSAIISRLLMYDNTLTDTDIRTILDDNSVVSTGADANGTAYTCKRPSPELIYKNWYGGQINRKSVKVQNFEGTKSAIYNIETVIDASNNLVRREVRHVNSGKTRYWFNEEIN